MKYILLLITLLIGASISDAVAQQTVSPPAAGWEISACKPLSYTTLDSVLKGISTDRSEANSAFFVKFSNAMDSISIDLNDDESIDKYILTAETYASARHYLPEEQAILYGAMADLMFSRLSDSLRICISSKKETDQGRIAFLQRTLSKNGYLLNLKTSNVDKFWHYLSEGRFEYVFRKLTTTYLSEFMLALCAGLISLTMIFLLYRKNRQKNKNHV
jgi:hypothetical protein